MVRSDLSGQLAREGGKLMKANFKRVALMALPAILAATAVACAGSAQGSTPPTISPDVFAPIPTPRPFGQAPTPSPTPFVLGLPSATPTAPVVISTPNPTITPTLPGAPIDPTPSATAEPTSVPTPTATPAGTPSPTATAQPSATVEPTATSTPGATATPEPTQTPEPTATSTPDPVAPGGIVYQAESASIIHNPESPSPEVVATGIDVSDFSIDATFGNPFHATFRPYSYGVKFRDTGDDYQALVIKSDGSVLHLMGTPGVDGEIDTFTVLNEFDYDGVLTSGSESNYIHLTVIEGRGWLYVNGVLQDEFVVADASVSSDVSLIAEVFNETDISGAIVDLTNVIAREAVIATQISEGSLVKVAGEVTHSTPTAPVRETVITASFIVPYESILGRWTAGIEFYEPVSGATNWFVFDDRQRWKHYRAETAGGEIVEVDGALINWLNRDRDDVNDLLIIGASGKFEVFINGQFVTTIAFEESDVPAQISAIAGFNEGDQPPNAPTRFTDYTVWSLGD